MRAIDADKLLFMKADLTGLINENPNYNLWEQGYQACLDNVQKQVNSAPTLVDTVYASWGFKEPDKHGNRKPYCTNCGEYHLTNWSDYTRCKICPSCGAKMMAFDKRVSDLSPEAQALYRKLIEMMNGDE